MTLVKDGDEAVKVFQEVALGIYQMIVVDIQMLKMNGIEATKAVCINPSTLKKCAPVLEGGYMKSSTKRF
ncbi:response regulator [Eubacterium callanderi]|nr:response regulator [Eubacterium callanderi]